MGDFSKSQTTIFQKFLYFFLIVVFASKADIISSSIFNA